MDSFEEFDLIVSQVESSWNGITQPENEVVSNTKRKLEQVNEMEEKKDEKKRVREEEKLEESNISLLPNIIWKYIFTYISRVDYLNLKICCKRFEKIITSHFIFFMMINYGDPIISVLNFAKKCSKLEKMLIVPSLNTETTKMIPKTVSKLILEGRITSHVLKEIDSNIEHLDISRSEMYKEDILRFLPDHLLSLSLPHIRDKDLFVKILKRLNKLNSLTLRNTSWEGQNMFVKEQELLDHNITSLLSNFKKLKLYPQTKTYFGNTTYKEVTKRNTLLKVLEIKHLEKLVVDCYDTDLDVISKIEVNKLSVYLTISMLSFDEIFSGKAKHFPHSLNCLFFNTFHRNVVDWITFKKFFDTKDYPKFKKLGIKSNLVENIISYHRSKNFSKWILPNNVSTVYVLECNNLEQQLKTQFSEFFLESVFPLLDFLSFLPLSVSNVYLSFGKVKKKRQVLNVLRSSPLIFFEYGKDCIKILKEDKKYLNLYIK